MLSEALCVKGLELGTRTRPDVEGVEKKRELLVASRDCAGGDAIEVVALAAAEARLDGVAEPE